MFDGQLVIEANRQFTLCNACRYCEGLCEVFPEMELRTAFSEGDLSHLANLCHDCRACADACPFSEPHEFAIEIPTLMSTLRAESFASLAKPAFLWRMLADRTSLMRLALLAGICAVAAIFVTGDPSAIIHRHRGSGSFYAVIPHTRLVVIAAAITVIALVAIAVSAWNMMASGPGGLGVLRSPRALAVAARDAVTLRNLKGGGGGCGDSASSLSRSRRHLHHLVLGGFVMMFASTVAAAIEQEFMGLIPPYQVLSVPVLLGTIGGIATAAGCLGFLLASTASRDPVRAPGSRRLDRSFTTLLLAAVLTGLLTLVLRSTVLMGPALILHLGVLGAFFITLPYGKFVHAIYRYLALVRAEVGADAPR